MTRRTGPESPDEPEAEWSAYTDYSYVTRRVAKSVGDAVEAIETLESAKRTGEKISAREETDLRASVLSATTRLRTELENGRERNELYDEILTRWDGEDGFLERFRNADLVARPPEPWLGQFATDIHRAGWELGYLKAGREEKETRGGDPDDGQVRDMFEGNSE